MAFRGALDKLAAIHDEEVEALQQLILQLRLRIQQLDAPLLCPGAPLLCPSTSVDGLEVQIFAAETSVASSARGNVDGLASRQSESMGEGTGTDPPERPNPLRFSDVFSAAAGPRLCDPGETPSAGWSKELKESANSEDGGASQDDCLGRGTETSAAVTGRLHKSWHSVSIQQQIGSLQAEMEKIPLSKTKRMQKSLWKLRSSTEEQVAKWTSSWVVKQPLFDGVCALMIVVNSVIIGCSVDWQTKYHDDNYNYQIAGHVCAAFFAIELLIRVHSRGICDFCWGENKGWNIFDSLLVLLSVLDLATQKSPWGSSMKLVKMLRIVRVFRVFRFFRALSLLALMIVDSLMSLGWAIVLVTIIMYVFAIWFTQRAHDHIYTNFMEENQPWMEDLPEVQRMFGALHLTIYTLMQATLGGVSWGVASDALLTISFDSALLFFFYIAFTILAVLNIVTGVFVDNAVETAQTQREFLVQKEMEIREKYICQMRNIFREMDIDCSGNISVEELREYFQDETMISYFQALGLDPNDTERLFYLLDDDCSGGISMDEFLTGCLRLKGQARSIDIHAMLHDLKKVLKKFDGIEHLVRQDPTTRLSREAPAERKSVAGLLPELVRTAAAKKSWNSIAPDHHLHI